MKLFAILLVSIPAAMANFSGSSQSCVRTACDTCTSS
ncbi:hypothetical protein JI435_423110 [Parastagonospora nodorum SN15]|uniref:Uncharacterized protein n=1 Tax=Phaeosphaeria nodorum (strain SN15 / ATCC MYA-4574 / FGSC 10173) TaxID=321614 RepID=A0A7U2IAB2_PHANO|nr:hypothetical protein JI435_423110 [Parastagonospora nodorum SN15]